MTHNYRYTSPYVKPLLRIVSREPAPNCPLLTTRYTPSCDLPYPLEPGIPIPLCEISVGSTLLAQIRVAANRLACISGAH